jgi:hypothetical protein
VGTSGAILSLAALLWGFVQAPFFHIHTEHLDHPATAAPAHLHLHMAPRGESPIISAHTADDDAIDVEWSIAPTSVVVFAPDLAIAEAIPIPLPLLVSATVITPQYRAHDPPELTAKTPRAPPA